MDVVHKRCIDNRANGNRTWQLCDRSFVFFGDQISSDNPDYINWRKTAKYRWGFVTCMDCWRIKAHYRQPKW